MTSENNSHPHDAFWRYWTIYVESGVREGIRAMRGSFPALPPHGISFEAGELLLSAWVGSSKLDRNLVPRLWEAAKRIVAESSPPSDCFELEFWNALHPQSLNRLSGDDEENVSSSYGTLTPRIKLVRIDLVALDDFSQSEMPSYLAQSIVMPSGDPIPIQVPQVRVISNTPLEVNVQRSDPFVLNFQDCLTTGYSTPSGNHFTVALVRFGDMYDLLARGNSIFDENVRGFLGHKSVTNRRLESAFRKIAYGEDLESIELFPFLNNGITLCCNGYSKTDVIRMDNPRVVNGQQTLRCWLYVYEDSQEETAKKRLKDIQVSVRLLQLALSDDSRKIAFANNRQNAVSAIDLRSNEPSMTLIEQAFERTFTTSPRIVFRRKSGDAQQGPIVDAHDIYYLFQQLHNTDISEEDFFDSHFYEQFDPLGSLLANNQTKVRRLIGLIILSRANVGKGKRSAIAALLDQLGVNRNTLGTEPNSDNVSERRMLVYALWKRIKQGLLHQCLAEPNWLGADQIIRVFEKKKHGRKQAWEPSAAFLQLLFGIKLPTSLLTTVWADYVVWCAHKQAIEEEIEDDDVRVETFVNDEITLNSMLKLLNTKPHGLLDSL